MKLRLFIVLFFAPIFLFSQDLKPLFPNGSNVCFVGNSITNNGEFYNNLWLFYATRFPQEKIRFYNCGISGDVAAGVLRRLDSDVLIHKPTHAVLMIGMNDVNRELYRKQQTTNSLKQKALAVYRGNTEQAMINLKKKPIGLILLKPSIYDQTSTIPTENFYGVNDALQQCAKHIEYLSKEYKTGLVDMQSVMLGINSVEQQKNPTFTIVGKDRVHPASPGHFVMAYQFLKDTKAPKYVSKIVIDPGHASSSLKSANCSIINLKRNRESISFSCLENSLPFPVRDSAKIALNWIPFNEEFNKELLQVDLPRGTYDLFIDDRKITSCSSTLFKKGINLADYPITPQYLQALTVLKACAAYREKESIIRNLRFIEFTQLAEWKGGNDTTALRNYLGRKLENLRNGGHYNYYKTQFNKYFINRIKEKETQLGLDALAGEIYMLNQPKVHLFRIEKQRKQITKA